MVSFEPYHNGDNEGLAFSKKPPAEAMPSTRNIFTAVENDYPSFQRPPCNGGSLAKWADRGVLLLNLKQTVRAHEPGSHSHIGWGSFTRRVVDIIASTQPGVVFLAWGAQTQALVRWLPSRHLVLRSPHPSPLSARLGFFGCEHFRQANDWLVAKYGHEAEIDWSLRPGTSTLSQYENEPKPVSNTNEKYGTKLMSAHELGRSLGDFHLFIHLPPELRRKIYIMATPPRVVHVQEWPTPTITAMKNFINHHLNETLPHDIDLPSSLDHFKSYWLPKIPEDIKAATRQKTLDDYGFISSRKCSRRPIPTDKCRIDPLWLSEQPDVAWYLCRRSELYSKAQIPPLLQTCRESRSMLKTFGYTLAFATRSSPPQTWFHFERDTLYMNREAWLYNYEDSPHNPSLLTMQFIPADLLCVRNLCLSFRVSQDNDDSHFISHILRFIPRLKTLYCENCALDIAAQNPWDGQGTNIRKRLAQTQSTSSGVQKEMWTMVKADIADFKAPSLTWTRHYRQYPTAISENWLSQNEASFSSPDDLIQHVVMGFYESLQILNDRNRGAWSVPMIEIVNVGTPQLIAELLRDRREYWDAQRVTV